MAKIAVELERALKQREQSGSRGGTSGRVLAQGDGWVVEDVLCTSGPQDRSFEEQHDHVAIALVVAGSFQYRAATGPAVMTPGSVLLGNPAQCFECGHEHISGDRCISFRYAPGWFEQVASDAGFVSSQMRFRVPRLPPLRELSRLFARASAGILRDAAIAWDELAVELAAHTLQLANTTESRTMRAPAHTVARVSELVRTIERWPDREYTLAGMAREAGSSPYHFLRSFEQITGTTPHQYILRTRMREAAVRLVDDQARVIDVVFDSGFGDVSNFNRSFRAEYGESPRAWRSTMRAAAG